jgi:hypothetical protein
MTHVYSDTFFDYIDGGARRSAQGFLALLQPWLTPDSVLDLGSGRGVWLDEWRKAGASSVLAVDGDYVDRGQLAVPQDSFLAADLTVPIDTGRRFDLAQSLEVGEHLPATAAATLIDSLTRASDRILFSAAVRGQGGEFHVNEQPLSYWQDLFAARGYQAYDCLRPRLKSDRTIEPWYRYNAVLYVNVAGSMGLPDVVRDSAVAHGEILHNGGDAMWRLRQGVVSQMPLAAVTKIAKAKAAILAAHARFNATAAGRR